jgi:hypothetical protein
MRLEMRKDAAIDAERCVKMQLEMHHHYHHHHHHYVICQCGVESSHFVKILGVLEEMFGDV